MAKFKDAEGNVYEAHQLEEDGTVKTPAGTFDAVAGTWVLKQGDGIIGLLDPVPFERSFKAVKK